LSEGGNEILDFARMKAFQDGNQINPFLKITFFHKELNLGV